ncbi:hypothetical protein GE061_007162 [Apolygus lucorum]|uniref:Uncharacterized protein n=1 Tax=Apolygus lucorum TaxID=248454 RepID=A0A8S9WR58_APOLU|nr:hypothetical protein GE061_007162 [Apolygus lucorum]
MLLVFVLRAVGETQFTELQSMELPIMKSMIRNWRGVPNVKMIVGGYRYALPSGLFFYQLAYESKRHIYCKANFIVRPKGHFVVARNNVCS